MEFRNRLTPRNLSSFLILEPANPPETQGCDIGSDGAWCTFCGFGLRKTIDYLHGEGDRRFNPFL
jgi:hypothetical protein